MTHSRPFGRTVMFAKANVRSRGRGEMPKGQVGGGGVPRGKRSVASRVGSAGAAPGAVRPGAGHARDGSAGAGGVVGEGVEGAGVRGGAGAGSVRGAPGFASAA